MRLFVSCAAAIALLSACSEAEVEEPVVDDPVEEAVVTDANGDTMEAYLGDWDVTYPDGSTGVTTNNADGTYTVTMADGTTMQGSWVFGAEESCWTEDGAEPICYTVGAPDENGTRELTMADGTVIMVTPHSAAEGDEAM